MKIIFSVEPIRFPLTGIGRYAYELARHLTQNPAVDELRYFTGYGFVSQLPTKNTMSERKITTSVKRVGRLFARNSTLLEIGRLFLQTRQRRNLACTSDYLYHGPNFYLPEVRGPAVVTFHDLSILTMPECHPVERVRFMSKEIMLSLKRATIIITDSDYVRDQVADYFSWPLERIRTVPLAGGSNFSPRNAREVAPDLRALDLIPGGYALYAGTIEPRKNLERLLIAYEQLDVRLRRHYPLILAGYRGWNNDAIIERVRRAEREGWARYVGYVSNSILPSLFAGARLFVFPSLHEGFGLPVLEAMASGVPVVCSNSSSLPEVAGGAAAMCSPLDVDELSRLIAQGLEEGKWRRQAVDKGLLRAGTFSWHRCTTETVDVYRAALEL